MPSRRKKVVSLIVAGGVLVQLFLEANKIYHWISNDIKTLAIIRIVLLVCLLFCLVYLMVDKKRKH